MLRNSLRVKWIKNKRSPLLQKSFRRPYCRKVPLEGEGDPLAQKNTDASFLNENGSEDVTSSMAGLNGFEDAMKESFLEEHGEEFDEDDYEDHEYEHDELSELPEDGYEQDPLKILDEIMDDVRVTQANERLGRYTNDYRVDIDDELQKTNQEIYELSEEASNRSRRDRIRALLNDTLKILVDGDERFLHENDTRRKYGETTTVSRDKIRNILLQLEKNNIHRFYDIASRYAAIPQLAGPRRETQSYWTQEMDHMSKRFFRTMETELNKIFQETATTTTTYRAPLAKELLNRIEDEEHKHDMSVKLEEAEYADDVTYFTKDECQFCGPNRHVFPLEVMNIRLLLKYTNDYGLILPRRQTGLCTKHQRRVAKLVKQAKHLNLLTNKKSEFAINDPFIPQLMHGPQVIVDDTAGDPEYEGDKLDHLLRGLRISREGLLADVTSHQYSEELRLSGGTEEEQEQLKKEKFEELLMREQMEAEAEEEKVEFDPKEILKKLGELSKRTEYFREIEEERLFDQVVGGPRKPKTE